MNQGQPVRIDISKLPKVACTCGNTVFRQEFELARVSPLQSPTGKAEYLPLSITKCNKCDKIISDPKTLDTGVDEEITETSQNIIL